MIAAAKGFDDIVEMLLENGADVLLTEAYHKRSAVHFAASGGFCEVLKLLLSNENCSKLLYLKDVFGLTPESVAHEYEQRDTALFLRSRRRDLKQAYAME